jgi:hypothetical protein
MKYRNGQELLPGWKLTFQETANGVFRVVLRNEYGPEIATTCTDPELQDTIVTMKADVLRMMAQLRAKRR